MAFESFLFQELTNHSIETAGWVILPTHYHLLVEVENLDTVSDCLKQVHGQTAREWNLQDGQTGKRKVWYKFYDRVIRSDHHFYQALNYIHFNPVKHGFAKDPFEWVWSSLKVYFETNGREWLRSKWKEFPIQDMNHGWGE